VKEQSHKREMQAAVRGDFARLRARGVPTTLSVDDDTPAPADAEHPPPTRSDEPPAPATRPSAIRRLFRAG
jgi:hypothetical protein